VGRMVDEKLGIFGGAFNPVHYGHLLVAETAFSQCGLSRVLWMPTYSPSHKKNTDLVAFQHRSNMVQQAIADHPHFTITNLQTDPEAASYAIATIFHLQQIYSSTDWYWIIGADAFQTLPQWRKSAELASQCTWLVAPRPPLDTHQVCTQVATQLNCRFPLRWQVLAMPQLEVSSSLIRHYCQVGRSLRYLVPDSVRQYINTHQLYQS
jgi:nicotinate-nucleotide adenylyltransferase